MKTKAAVARAQHAPLSLELLDFARCQSRSRAAELF
jgi:hypothetical protein